MDNAIDLINKVLKEIETLLADGKGRTAAEIKAGIPSGKLITDDSVSNALALLETAEAVKRVYVGI